jgi:RNA polymerase sigma factor (sigma-70 family)
VSFATTRWSLVLRARRPDADGQRALDELLAAYWQPVYVLYRRLGARPQDAEDLTQGLFAHLLARGDLATATPERGRFRAFLATCARHWWANERERTTTSKRGGDVRVRSLDAADAERWLDGEADAAADPALAFDRRWARTVLDRATSRLERQEQEAGRGTRFAELRDRLADGDRGEPWSALAARIGVNEGALRVAAHRLRARLRDCVLAELRDTVEHGVELEDEVRALLAALAASPAADVAENP